MLNVFIEYKKKLQNHILNYFNNDFKYSYFDFNTDFTY